MPRHAAALIVVCLCLPGLLRAATPPTVADLQPADPTTLWVATNSELTAVATPDHAILYRWALQAGETATLTVRADHPLLHQLRAYDTLDLELRIAAGAISTANLQLLGHVSGPRQAKIHDWQLAIRGTPPATWHGRHFDLARPDWFPWDSPDGTPARRFLTLSALAMEPGTVIELRGLRLTQGLIRLKPDFELPVTWPRLSLADDGSATYTLEHRVQNASGAPTAITAELLSTHTHFTVTLQAAEPDSPAATRVTVPNLKHAQTTTIRLTAHIPAAAIAATPELYAEDLHLVFHPASDPDARIHWRGHLVRPLSPSVRRQALLSPDDIATIRQHAATRDTPLARALDLPAILADADAFLAKDLIRIPGSHAHPANRWIGDWRPTDRMPEARNTKTGEIEFGTLTADRTWKEYLGHTGRALEQLAYAYLFTGDERYAQKAITLLDLYARQYPELTWDSIFEPDWSDGPAILASARNAATSTYGTNWFYKNHCLLYSAIADSPSWTPDTRARVDHFIRVYATELMKFHGGISNMTDITNQNLLLLGLASRDPGLVHHALTCDAGLLRRLDDIMPDGFSSEGRPLNYHFAAMAEYLPAYARMANARLSLDIPRDRLLAAIRMPYQRAALTTYVPNSGDNGRGGTVRPTVYADWLHELFPTEDWLRDLGTGDTIHARILAHTQPRDTPKDAWRSLLETTPRHFPHAGYAILRTGDTPDTQIMLTLDYGRNPMHAHRDRGAISLSAFGHLYTHGPGSLYNIGSGGITRPTDKRLDSFINSGSLSQNIILVDQQQQLPAVGRLLHWDPSPAHQTIAAHIPGIAPGVHHIRQLTLTQGIAILIDELRADTPHTYDWVYHNFGAPTLGPRWTSTPLAGPLATTTNYENLIDPQTLRGDGPIHLTWTVADNAHLALWQLTVPDSQPYLATTALNNPQTRHIPAPTPTLIHRRTGATLRYFTVLEPYTHTPRVTAITPHSPTAITLTLRDADPITLHLTPTNDP